MIDPALEAHQPHVNGESAYDFEGCRICRDILKRARDWRTPNVFTPDDQHVDAYRNHAKKMSES